MKSAIETGVDEASLLKEAVGFAAEHRFYLRKAVQHGDFYSAVRHSLCMANELRSSKLSPQSYYKLYSMVFVELQYLGTYLQETERHGFSLEEVFEIVQYEGNCLPRLYMLVTVGVVRMLAPEESPDEVLCDMEFMVGAVQHPVRGLFLRYFLLQVVKDKLHKLRDGAAGALNFLLTTFREAVSLWHRLRLAPEAQHEPSAWELDDHRHSLRLLLGAHLMQVARVDGLTQDLYTEVVLPELLRLIPTCEDAAGQATLPPVHNSAAIPQVFPDNYHLHTLDKILSTCAQVHWSIDLTPLTQHLLRRLTVHLEGGDGFSVDVFGLFHVHLKHLHGRPRTAATPLISLLTLQLELCMFVLALQPGSGCLEILEGTVDLLNSGDKAETSQQEVLDTTLAEAVVDLMAAPLTQAGLCSTVLQMPYHSSLLAMLSRAMQGRAAMAMVTAILVGDVSLSDCLTLRQLFALMSTLLHDETGFDDGDRPRHLEHDPIAFRREQETVAQLIHQVRHDDPAVVIEMLFVLWEYFQKGGPHRIIFTVPAMVTAVLQLADRLTLQGRNREEECSNLIRILGFMHTLCQSLGTLVPKESVRLWLLCAASADRAAAAKECTELTNLLTSSVDKALGCMEEHIPKQEAQLCGLQLLVGTLQQMKVGPEDAVKLRQRAMVLCSKMLSKRFQSKAFCLCCELFWLPQPERQDPDNGLLCLRRALQSADGAIHSDPSDVGLFVDILNKVARLFDEGACQVSPAVLSKTISLCVQHVRYIGARVPIDSMRALRAILSDLAAKQVDSVEAVMAGDANVSYLEVDLRSAELLPARSPNVKA